MQGMELAISDTALEAVRSSGGTVAIDWIPKIG